MVETLAGWQVSEFLVIRDKMATECYELSVARRAISLRYPREMGQKASRIHPETAAQQWNF